MLKSQALSVPNFPLSLALLIALALAAPTLAQPPLAQPPLGETATAPILPPLPTWEGATQTFLAAPGDPWITDFEASGGLDSPDYDTTLAWLRRLAAAAPEIELLPFGTSSEGRTLWLVVATTSGHFSPAALHRDGKPILLAQAGIHAGEIDGKDAGLMLLRDMTVANKRRDLLEGAHFLFIPIFNVDGHERRSAHGRVNQRGPREMGWRTTARNLNLNRDYAKADAPEMRALLRLLGAWDPDLYVDLHVTDGVDYQYDITWGGAPATGYSPAAGAFIRDHLTPRAERDLEALGHIPGPLVLAMGDDLSAGILDWTGSPRFSNSYGDARHTPTLLVENHSLKPYAQRVLGTYALLESFLETLAEKGDVLRAAIREDRARRPAEVPVTWKSPDGTPQEIDFRGIRWERRPSEITGEDVVVWTGEPEMQRVKILTQTLPDQLVRRPKAYWIPPVWSEVIARLEDHGIEMERLAGAREVDVEMYRFRDVELGDQAFEGHVRVMAEADVETHRELYPAGSVRIPLDQPLGDLAMLLLEPMAADSFFQWGFFLEILQRTEYIEGYVLEPMARRMLEEDPALRAEFEKKLAEDSDFAGDPRARLRFFYERTPYFDARWRLYPVGREMG